MLLKPQSLLPSDTIPPIRPYPPTTKPHPLTIHIAPVSNKTTPLTFQVVPLPDEQAFTSMNLWGQSHSDHHKSLSYSRFHFSFVLLQS